MYLISAGIRYKKFHSGLFPIIDFDIFVNFVLVLVFLEIGGDPVFLRQNHGFVYLTSLLK
jgi:hypothetical protein